MNERIPHFIQITSATSTDIVSKLPMAQVFGLDDQGQVWTYLNSGWTKLARMSQQ